MAILEIENLSAFYGKAQALDNVSFSLQRGTFSGLLGPNGAGKSTLFQIISGLLVPDGGTVRILGKTHRRQGAYIRSRLGVVFQVRSVDLDISVDANLKFHGELFGITGRRLHGRIAELCDFLRLSGMRKRLVRTLCPHCKAPAQVDVRRRITEGPADPVALYDLPRHPVRPAEQLCRGLHFAASQGIANRGAAHGLKI